MEQTSKATRPKLRNVAVPHQVVKCFLCGKPLLDVKGNMLDGATANATGGIIILTCTEDVEAADALIKQNIKFLKQAMAVAKERQEQQSKIE